MGIQCRSVRLCTGSRSAEQMLTRARSFLRKPGSGTGNPVGWPCASADAPRGFRVCARQAEQSQSTVLQGRLQKRSIWWGEKLSAGGSLGFCRLWADPRGNFSVSLTSFPKKPLKKRENVRDRDRRNRRFWLAPPPSALDLVKQLKSLTHLGSYIFHQDECISFMSPFWTRLHAQWTVLSASGGNGIKQSWPGYHKGCSKT